MYGKAEVTSIRRTANPNRFQYSTGTLRRRHSLPDVTKRLFAVLGEHLIVHKNAAASTSLLRQTGPIMRRHCIPLADFKGERTLPPHRLKLGLYVFRKPKTLSPPVSVSPVGIPTHKNTHWFAHHDCSEPAGLSIFASQTLDKDVGSRDHATRKLRQQLLGSV